MSKYVNPTGPGYQGVAKVSVGLGATLAVGMYDVDWREGTEVYVVFEDDGVALFESDHRPSEFVRTLTVKRAQGGAGPHLGLSGPDLRPLEVEPGDDVRVYKRDEGGLLVVPADGDPILEADDG